MCLAVIAFALGYISAVNSKGELRNPFLHANDIGLSFKVSFLCTTHHHALVLPWPFPDLGSSPSSRGLADPVPKPICQTCSQMRAKEIDSSHKKYVRKSKDVINMEKVVTGKVIRKTNSKPYASATRQKSESINRKAETANSFFCLQAQYLIINYCTMKIRDI